MVSLRDFFCLRLSSNYESISSETDFTQEKNHFHSLLETKIPNFSLLLQNGWIAAEWEKVWSRLSSHLQPFSLVLARILTVFNKKRRFLMCPDKRESYLIVLQQNNV